MFRWVVRVGVVMMLCYAGLSETGVVEGVEDWGVGERGRGSSIN